MHCTVGKKHMPDITRLNSRDIDFRQQLDTLLAREQESDTQLESAVRAIIEDVRIRGDVALVEYTAVKIPLQSGAFLE